MFLAAIFAPLVGFIVALGLGRFLTHRFSQLVTCSFLGLSAVLSCMAFRDAYSTGVTQELHLLTWFSVGNLSVDWSVYVSTISTLMAVVVTTVSFCVHLYSIGYMAKDPSVPRFMAYLSLFTFMMLMLVTAANFVQLFFGWEGVGLTSYLLIGFWYHKDSANAAAMKAFVVNRVGDLGLVLGIALIYMAFGTLHIDTFLSKVVSLGSSETTAGILLGGQSLFFEHTPLAYLNSSLGSFLSSFPLLEVIAFFLFLGAMGKSAQLGLHTWLPDAMEGPTPVSALIHAATMVTAGVFLLVRVSPLLDQTPLMRDIITIIGATTAFFAGTVALAQNDIKRVIAYSTCSQLGYMFFAIGVGAYNAAFFHLFTHAFFKALLFLGAGAVIHSFSGEQDMRNMGGVWKKIPFTYALMWIGSLAIIGTPFLSGYYSKTLILEAVWSSSSSAGTYAFIIGTLVSMLTAYYSWRLLWLAFHGTPRCSEAILSRLHESPIVMLLPMIILAGGALFSGALAQKYNLFPLTFAVLPLPGALALFSKGIVLVGVLVAIYFYSAGESLRQALKAKARILHTFLYNKWYFDELYQKLFVAPTLYLGKKLWISGDQQTIDGYGPDGITESILKTSRRMSHLQTGYIYHYTLAMAVGVGLLAIIYIFRG